MGLHLLAVRIANGNVDRSHLAELLKDSLEYALARPHILVRFLVARTEPADGQIGQMHGVRPFARLHFVHVTGVAEERVPGVPCRIRVLGQRGAHLDQFREVGQLDVASVETIQYAGRFLGIVQFAFEPDKLDRALADLQTTIIIIIRIYTF